MKSSTKSISKTNQITKSVYTLNLSATSKQIDEELGRWQIVSTASIPTMEVLEDTISIGDTEGTTFLFPPLEPLSNCRTEFDIRIVNDGGDASRWAGIRVRAFLYDIRFGYLVYLRSSGTVELYRAGEVLEGANRTVVPNTKDSWTHIRVDIYNSKIWVFVNGRQHLYVTDRKFRDKDLICLHTFGTQAQFRKLRVFKLLRNPHL